MIDRVAYDQDVSRMRGTSRRAAMYAAWPFTVYAFGIVSWLRGLARALTRMRRHRLWATLAVVGLSVIGETAKVAAGYDQRPAFGQVLLLLAVAVVTYILGTSIVKKNASELTVRPPTPQR